LGLGRYGVLALIMVMYVVLGCLMDVLAMVILTVPIIFPVIKELGFDPIWFGVIIVMTVELGLIHPPVGMIVFVIKSVIQDINFSTIFAGVLPFLVPHLVGWVFLIPSPITGLCPPPRMGVCTAPTQEIEMVRRIPAPAFPRLIATPAALAADAKQ